MSLVEALIDGCDPFAYFNTRTKLIAGHNGLNERSW